MRRPSVIAAGLFVAYAAAPTGGANLQAIATFSGLAIVCGAVLLWRRARQ